jgi:hypothetical protein
MLGPCGFSNIKKCNFKDCPLTSVAPLIVFVPIIFLHVHGHIQFQLQSKGTRQFFNLISHYTLKIQK